MRGAPYLGTIVHDRLHGLFRGKPGLFQSDSVYKLENNLSVWGLHRVNKRYTYIGSGQEHTPQKQWIDAFRPTTPVLIENFGHIQNGQEEVDMLEIAPNQFVAYIIREPCKDSFVAHVFNLVGFASRHCRRCSCAHQLEGFRAAGIQNRILPCSCESS